MNRKKIMFIATILFGIIVAGCTDNMNFQGSNEPIASNSEEQEIKLAWEFPEISGTQVSDTLKTFEELLSIYNIPDAILNSVSTEELVDICMAYPLWGLMHAYNDRRTGMTVLIHNFNGFQELFNRNDAAIVLLNAYDKLDPIAVDPSWTPLEQGTFSANFEKYEMFLTSKLMIDKLDNAGIKNLKEVVISKYQKKKELPEIYSLWDLSPIVAICVNILEKENQNILKLNSSEINQW